MDNKEIFCLRIKRIIRNNLPVIILEPLKRLYSDMRYVVLHVIPVKWHLKWRFKKQVGYSLNLDNPRTFNEKLQWLKLHDRNPLYTKMVDKYEAKKYVADVIGAEYIIPTLGVWNCFDEIDFNKLPKEFVLKCTHDSGSVVICWDKDKLDKKEAKKTLERGLRCNYYYSGSFEWPYKNVKPRIIAETLMKDKSGSELTDYKIMCFNGHAECSFTCTGRNNSRGLHVTFYDRSWRKMPFDRHYPSEKEAAPKPQTYEKMLDLAEKLAINLKFVRVDFYDVNGQIYFGEITFFPGGGFEEFYPEIWDKKLGEWINL